MENYTSNIPGKTFHFVDLEDHKDLKLTRCDLLGMFPIFKEFVELYKCSIDTLCAMTYNLGMLDKTLFEYTTYECNGNNVLVAEKGVYYYKKVYGCYNTKYVIEYKNVYIRPNTYVNLRLAEIAKELIKESFPLFTQSPFVRRTRRFDETISKLPRNQKVKANDLDTMVLLNNNITIEDLVKLYTDPGYKNSWIQKPVWSIYSDYKNIFFDITGKNDGHSVIIPVKALFEKDWKAVEEFPVQSICLYDENDKIIPKKWFKGFQKDAPYMSTDIAKALKEYFLS